MVNEINILGVTVFNSLFTTTTPDKFPNGLVVQSNHPGIHTRIERDLGPGSVQARGCNVIMIGIPDVGAFVCIVLCTDVRLTCVHTQVTFKNIEFDNSGR